MSTWLTNKRVRLFTFLIVTLSLILPQSIWLSSTPVALADTTVTITGTVHGWETAKLSCDAPIEGATVGLYDYTDFQNPKLVGATTTTGANGTYSLVVLVPTAPSYNLRVVAKKQHYQDTNVFFYQGTGPLPTPKDVGTMTLKNASISYFGHVYDANSDNHYPNNYPNTFMDDSTMPPTQKEYPKRMLAGATVEMVVRRKDGQPVSGTNTPYGQTELRTTTTTNANGYYAISVSVPVTTTSTSYDVDITIRKDGFVRSMSTRSKFVSANRTCQQEHQDTSREVNAGLTPGYTIINKLADANSKAPITTSGWRMRFYDTQGNREADRITNLDSDGWFRTEFPYNELDIDKDTGTSPDRVFQVYGVGKYPVQYLGKRADGTIEGKIFKNATPYKLNTRGSNNLQTVELYGGSAVSGILYDHQADKILQDAWMNILVYDTQKNLLDLVYLASFDSKTGTYTTDPIFPGDVYLEFSGFKANIGEDKIEYSYISRFFGNEKPTKTDYYLASAQKVTIPATGETVTGKNVYFDRCATVKGKVSAANQPMTYQSAVVKDFYGQGNDWSDMGSGWFSFEYYDPNTGNWTGISRLTPIASDGTYKTPPICYRDVATLGQFKFKFTPRSTTSCTLKDPGDKTTTPPREPQAECKTTNYESDFLPYWYGSNAYSIRDAKAQPLKPGQELELNVNFERGGVVTGTLSTKSKDKESLGQLVPIPDPSIQLINQGGDIARWTPDTYEAKYGHFSFTNVAPGNYTLFYGANGYTSEYFDDKLEFANADFFSVAASNSDTPNLYKDKNAVLSTLPALGIKLLNKETGNPIITTSFTLKLYTWDDVLQPVQTLPSRMSDTGIFTFTNVTPGRYRLYVEGWGFEKQWYDGKMGLDGRIADDIIIGNDDLTLEMKMQGRYGKGTFTGQVVRQDTQAPVVGNGVVAVHDAFSGAELATFPTNHLGEYKIGNVLDGEYNLRFESHGLVSEYHKDVLDSEDATDLVIQGDTTINVDKAELAVGGQIGVLVTAGGRPVPGINVQALDAVTGKKRGTVTTSTDGTSVIYGLPPGNYILTTDAWKQYEAYRSQSPIVVVANQQTDATIELKEGAYLVGQVTDEKSGQPINNAFVHLFRTDVEEWAGSSVWTNQQGYYQLNGVKPGQYIVHIWRDGYKPVWQNGNASKWDDAQPLDMKLGANTLDAKLTRQIGGFISGRVTLPGGQPARGVTVLAYLPQGAKPAQNQQGGWAFAWTDETGAYVLGGMPDGTYTVQFLPPSDTGYAMEWYNNKPSSADATEVGVTADSPAVGIDATLEKAPGVILGTVKVGTTDIPSATLAAAPGTPVKDAKVVVYRSDTHDKVGEAMTKYNGSYQIKGLVPETTYKAEVTASSPDYPLCVGGSDGSYAGHGSSDSDDCYAGQWYNLKPTIADADVIDLTKPMTPTQPTSPTLMVDTKEVSATVNFLLYKSGIGGRVTTEDGTPLPGSTVYFNGTHSVRTDATGHYTNTTLSSGDYKVDAMAHPTLQKKYNLVERGVYTKTEKVKVPMAGIVRNIDITIAAAATLSGTIMITPTQAITPTQPATLTLSAVPPVIPVAGVTAMLHKKSAGICASSSVASAVSDRRGHYAFERVEAGEYCLSLYPPSQGPTVGYGNQWFDGVFDPRLAQSIKLMPGMPMVQDVYLVKSPLRVPSSIKGVVVDQKRLPPPPKPNQPALAATGVITPLEGFTVKLYEVDMGGKPSQLAASAVTNTKGEYELTGLQPGKPYKIRIEPPAIGDNTDYLAHWFDRVLDPNRALWVAVPGGATKVLTITAMRKLHTVPLKAGKWICLDPRTNEVIEYPAPRPLLWCTFIPAGALSRDINMRFTRIEKDERASAALSSTSLQESVAPTDQTAFFFDVEAYWVDSGEVVTQTEKAVTMSIPYNDPDDLVYTPTGAMTPTQMGESRLKVNFWNDNTVTAPVSSTTGVSDTTFSPGWYDPTGSPWCTVGTECKQEVDATNNLVSITTNQFFDEYALLEGPPLSIYLPFIMREPTQPTTPTVTMTLTLR